MKHNTSHKFGAFSLTLAALRTFGHFPVHYYCLVSFSASPLKSLYNIQLTFHIKILQFTK